jgi:cation diffusion facilitator family transporter
MRLDDAELRERVRAGGVSLAVGVLVFTGKLAAWWATGSTAVLSDALESVVNVVAASLLLYSLVVAARPADRDHPYGHGKVEYFSAGVEGALIAVAALLIGSEAVQALLAGPRVRNLDVGLAIVALLTGLNALLGSYLVRTGRRLRSVALVADGQHVLTDVWTSLGVILGLAAVRVTGWVVLDPLVAIAVAANILRTGWKLLRGAVGGLMDEADQDLLGRVAAALEKEREPWWIDVHGLRTFGSGALRHTDLHLAVPRYFDAERLHRIHERVRNVVLGATAMPGDVLVHFDPCQPFHCPICTMPDCPVRAAPFARRPPISARAAVREDGALAPSGPTQEDVRP